MNWRQWIGDISLEHNVGEKCGKIYINIFLYKYISQNLLFPVIVSVIGYSILYIIDYWIFVFLLMTYFT